MPPKLSRQVLYFEQLCKEIDLFKEKVGDCEKDQQARVKILKGNIKPYETNLSESFNKLSAKENEDYMDMYLRYKGVILDLLVELEEKTEVTFLNSESRSELKGESNVKNSFVKLPKFDLPKFYGESEGWISFKELFVSTIIKNEQLSDIEKLQYLQASVRGNAAKLIRGFSLREEHLEQCWELLCERYENKRQLALSQISKIFSIKIAKANNSKTLLELLDTCNEAVRNLKTLGLESNKLSDLMLIKFMVGKLEEPLKQRWELTMDNDDIPDLDSFRKFVEREARSVEDTKSNKSESKFNIARKPFEVSGFKKQSIANNAIIKQTNNCILCNQNHALFKCPIFNSKPVTERWKIVENNHLCQNCLRGNHRLESCRINLGCKNCSEKHHTRLHVYSNSQSSERVNNVVPESSVSNSAQSFSSNVLLQTALIRVKDRSGKFIQCRALVDNASQNSLITKKCAERLNLSLRSTSHSLIGINCVVAETSLSQTEFEYTSHYSTELFSASAYVVDRVTSPLPNFHLQWHEWPHTKNLILADPKFYVCAPIEILLGAEQVSNLFNGSPIAGLPGAPTVFPTKIGHLLSGHIDLPSHSCALTKTLYTHATIISPTECKQSPSSLSNNDKSIENLTKTLKEFWEIESIPSGESMTGFNDNSEEMFAATVKRNSEGRYIVKLPFKENKNIGESKSGALSRFYTMENKLMKNKNLKSTYTEFIHEYRELHHMTEITSEELNLFPNYYLPHHAVINENSSTTKLRVVFDASFKTSNNKSLNEVLCIGPKLQTNIFDNLLKFRSYPIAFTADIAKMYRQILISDEDRQYQRIFWRDSPWDPLTVYKLNTITYGTACAPYLALRTLQQLCRDEQSKYPLAAEIASEHFYIDDLLAGAYTIESARSLIHELRELLLAGGFPLRKWACSHLDALSEIPEEDKANSSAHFFEEEFGQRVLGIFWNLREDTIQVRTVTNSKVLTKRQLLSAIAQVYDPLGLISPATVVLKLLLQMLWKLSVTWDEKIPSEVLETWNKFHSEIHHCKDMHIPRYMGLNNNVVKVELHGFCDASTKAYAAVAYLRVISNHIIVSLVASKTRVAPVKELTLPKLELCGAHLLSELIVAIKNAVKFTVHETFYWCDSSIALGWIANPPTKGNQFVTHRVSKIRALTALDSWRHIPGKNNPADYATRGLFPLSLKNKSEWWKGPKWLYENEYVLANVTQTTNLEDNVHSDQEDDSPSINTNPLKIHFQRFSSYLKLLRTIAWIFRFSYNSKNKSKRGGPLTALDLEESETCLVKIIQRSYFSNEINLLNHNKPLKPTNKLLPLNIFLDKNNILRVGGRLRQHQTFDLNQRHPILIPKSEYVTSLIIKHYHHTSGHAGPNLVLALIRQKFWIPHGRSTVRKELNRCILCFRLAARPLTQKMGDLPVERITPSRPFSKIGIDFAGPMLTKCEHKRKSNTFKSYICLFICLATKAVHLETVSSLSTDAFLSALRRFIGRRGYPSDIFSDNGRNFVGANSYMKHLFNLLKEAPVKDFSSQRRISWHFIPPYAPNFGGLWEASIKLTKNHLIKLTKGTLVTFEELSTLLCQVEACINSRPLVPLSNDPSDLEALTPGHFLVGSPLLEIPEHVTNPSTLSISSRYRVLLQMKESFWTRWTRDYLNTLNLRPKGANKLRKFHVGDLVTIIDKEHPPLQWTLGRLERLIPGKDNIIRVVEIKTAAGTFLRPVSQVAVLPTTGDPSLGRPRQDDESIKVNKK